VSSALPEDIRQFLLRYIDSVEQLEVLLLLRGSPGASWSPEAVAQALYSNPTSVAYRLAMLQRHELIVAADPPSSYRYQPASPALHEAVARVAEMYKERRVAVITFIASKPMANVRAFSDAFRLRKKDPE
jgi:hypothetical protein